jgi:hypothetical protein
LSLSNFETSGSNSTVERSWWTPAAPKDDDIFWVADPLSLFSSFNLAMEAVEELEICTHSSSIGACGGTPWQHFTIRDFMQSSYIIAPQMS